MESYSLLALARINREESVMPCPPAVLSARMSLLSEPLLSHRLMSLAAGALTEAPAQSRGCIAVCHEGMPAVTSGDWERALLTASWLLFLVL